MYKELLNLLKFNTLLLFFTILINNSLLLCNISNNYFISCFMNFIRKRELVDMIEI